MPTNLNALIRYKIINDCLSTGRGYSIDELIEACSRALEEHCGRYGGVSERTVSNDIKIMRSDILGFNAPIKSENGLYFNTDRNYSLASIFISDADLAKQIRELLNDIRDKISHPELEKILKQLNKVISRASGKYLIPDTKVPSGYEKGIPGTISFQVEKMPELTADAKWSDIFFLISGNISQNQKNSILEYND